MELFILTETYLSYADADVGSITTLFKTMAACKAEMQSWVDFALKEGAKVWLNEDGNHTTYYEGANTKWVYECHKEQL